MHHKQTTQSGTLDLLILCQLHLKVTTSWFLCPTASTAAFSAVSVKSVALDQCPADRWPHYQVISMFPALDKCFIRDGFERKGEFVSYGKRKSFNKEAEPYKQGLVK